MSLQSSPLTFLCTIHHVNIGIITNQKHIHSVGQYYTIEVYVAANESLLLQCFPVSLPHVPATPEQHRSLPEMTIDIASQSEVRLEQSHILIVPQLDNESWSLDCSASEPQEFTTLQDMLTHFSKFENRQKIQNTLAMVNPSSYQVTRIVAENVSLDQEVSNEKKSIDDDIMYGDQGSDDCTGSVVDADDFISTRENYYGQKLPVTLDENPFKDGLELRRVRLIQKTSLCMEVSSVWLARAIIRAGDSIAGYIQNGSKSVEEKGKTPINTQLVSSKQRRYFDIAFNLTTFIGNMAGEWFSKIFHLTAVKEASAAFQMPIPKTQLGNSAYQAAHKVMEGSFVAAGTVFSATRQGLLQVIEKKYGADAGYMARTIMGSDTLNEDVMVYFDNHGISRKVVMQSSHSATPLNIHNTTVNESSTSFVVYEDMNSEKLTDHRQMVYDIEKQGYLTEEKKKISENLVLV